MESDYGQHECVFRQANSIKAKQVVLAAKDNSWQGTPLKVPIRL